MAKKRPNVNRAGNMNVDKWREKHVSQRTNAFFLERDGAVPPVESKVYKEEYARQEALFNAERRQKRAAKHRKKDDGPGQRGEGGSKE